MNFAARKLGKYQSEEALRIPSRLHLYEPAASKLSQLAVPGNLTQVAGEVRVNSETRQLKSVVIGNPVTENYSTDSINPICSASRRTQLGEFRKVTLDEAQTEFELFKRVLVNHGVSVAHPPAVKGLYDQIYTRDIAVVVGDCLIPARMKTDARKPEPRALSNLLTHLHHEKIGKIKVAPLKNADSHPIYFEGGDIFVHGENIFIGHSQRTNQPAIDWFKREFGGSYNVIQLDLINFSGDQEALHLDCAFNLVGNHERPVILLHEGSFQNIDRILKSLPANTAIISVNDQEQDLLGTNLLCLNEQTVIMRDVCDRLGSKLNSYGIETVMLPFDAAASMGGLFRCCSMPLLRAN